MIIFQKITNHFRRSNSGMTLSEVLVVAVLTSMLMGGLLTVLTAGYDSWQANSLRDSQQRELGKAFAWISGDLIQSGSAVIDVPKDGVWYSTICFRKAVGVTNGSIDWSTNLICYGLDGTVFERDSKPVAMNIDVLQFRRQSLAPDVIEVNLRAVNTEFSDKWSDLTSTLAFKVRMRN